MKAEVSRAPSETSRAGTETVDSLILPGMMKFSIFVRQEMCCGVRYYYCLNLLRWVGFSKVLMKVYIPEALTT